MNETRQKKTKVTRKNQGRVVLLKERCKGCGFCVEFCPIHVLTMGDQLNSKGYHSPVIIKTDECSGCGLCGFYCPDFAIHGYRLTASKQTNQKGCGNEN